jgi:DNA-binding XRE family transcriptional regulator
MDPVSELDAVFTRIRALPDDEQFVAWNEVMDWLQGAMSDVASERRIALHRYRTSNNLTRRQLAERFGLTSTTVSRLMDEVSKHTPSVAA